MSFRTQNPRLMTSLTECEYRILVRDRITVYFGAVGGCAGAAGCCAGADAGRCSAGVVGAFGALEAGALSTLIGKTFPLADIVAAHEAVEGGKILGNVVVNIG